MDIHIFMEIEVHMDYSSFIGKESRCLAVGKLMTLSREENL